MWFSLLLFTDACNEKNKKEVRYKNTFNSIVHSKAWLHKADQQSETDYHVHNVAKTDDSNFGEAAWGNIHMTCVVWQSSWLNFTRSLKCEGKCVFCYAPEIDLLQRIYKLQATKVLTNQATAAREPTNYHQTIFNRKWVKWAQSWGCNSTNQNYSDVFWYLKCD